MAQARNEQDKKVLAVAQELSGLLTGYKYDEAWDKVKELNTLLKSDEGLTLPPYMVDMLKQHVRSFYMQNDKVTKAHKAMSAIGYKLAEFQ